MKRPRAPRTPTAPEPAPAPASPAPSEPTDKREKVTVWLRGSLVNSLRHEGVDRKLSLGDLIEEALEARIVRVASR